MFLIVTRPIPGTRCQTTGDEIPYGLTDSTKVRFLKNRNFLLPVVGGYILRGTSSFPTSVDSGPLIALLPTPY